MKHSWVSWRRVFVHTIDFCAKGEQRLDKEAVPREPVNMMIKHLKV